MRCDVATLGILGVLIWVVVCKADPLSPIKPFGLDQRVPWTTSKVVGSPNPPPPYRVVRAFPNLKLSNPIGVAHEPGTKNLLLIHQLAAWSGSGRLVRIKDDDGVINAEDFLSIDGIAYGVAFHPDYEKNGFLFVGDNGPMQGKKKTRVTRYTVSRTPPFAVDPKSAQVIIEWASDGHNGGDLAFGPDGMLYITTGDGTSDSDTDLAGQDLIAPTCQGAAHRRRSSRTWEELLRAEGQSVRRQGGRAAGDVGVWFPQSLAAVHRSADRRRLGGAERPGPVGAGHTSFARGPTMAGASWEGGHAFYPNRKLGPTPVSKPIVDHPHSEMRSLTGGIVYRGDRLPDLKGTYIYGDWSTGRIWGLRHESGKATWHQELATTTLQITGFGLDSKGELLIADHGGGYYRLEPTPREEHPAKFPTRLSETGIFLSVKDHRPHPGLIPYSVNAPLWSDGAAKERFLGLPGTSQIDMADNRGWNFADGTVLVKTFSLPTTAGPRRIETRLLTRQQGQWAGYSYLWNDDQSDALLVEAAGTNRTYEVRDGEGARKQTWHYPSRVECMVCHSRAANWVLGLTTLQMNKIHDYGGVADNQLRTLEHLGVFRVSAQEHVREARRRLGLGMDLVRNPLNFSLEQAGPWLPRFGQPAAKVYRALAQSMTRPLEALPKPSLDWLERRMGEPTVWTTRLLKRPEDYGRLVDPGDPKADLEARARSYLHANCAHCHVEAGGGNATINLEFTVPRAKMSLLDVRPQHHTFEIPEARIIAPGHPEALDTAAPARSPRHRTNAAASLRRGGPRRCPTAAQLDRCFKSGLSPKAHNRS